MPVIVAALLFLSFASCDLARQAVGQLVISVENTTDIDGFEVRANGERKFTLNAGDKKSFSLDGLGTSSVRIVVRHEGFNSDLVFTLTGPEEKGGGSAKLVISTEIRFGQTVAILTCTNCEERSKPI